MVDTFTHEQYPNLGFGLGFRPNHYNDILSNEPHVDWFEALGENYIGICGHGQSPLLEQLMNIKERYPVVLHFVSTNIGGTRPVDNDFLKQMKKLIKVVEPKWISDHLCWTGVHGKSSHDLLPLPYTKEAIEVVSSNIHKVQETLGQRFMIENTSSYVSYKHSEMQEWDFINAIVDKTDCGLLLDVNNVYVSAQNHDFNARTFIDAMPLRNVGQIHLAGHITDDNGLIIDTHDQPVCDEVMDLFEYTYNKFDQKPSVMIEWDAEIPSYLELVNELKKVKKRVAL